MTDQHVRTSAVHRMTMSAAIRWAVAPFVMASIVPVSSIAVAQVPTAPAPLRLFFDWGKASVSQDNAAALDDVAALLLQPGAGSARIVGHSDRSGSAVANRRSALHRAAAARDYLVARGVASRRIAISSMGEDAPFIATADGVREPQNRRVDVTIGATDDR